MRHQVYLSSLALAVATSLPGFAADKPRSGEQVVRFQCVLCHGPGQAGAPKIGDRKAWSDRAQAGGVDRLVFSASRGRGAMPPSGGLADRGDPEASIELLMAPLRGSRRRGFNLPA